ncbi:MGDG synthase family glycosyltransferase [Pseudalkalibacillus decolorationis]|uniref:MGDG synthase family glycosyltransferase n=1 Tax=Pseudalkalibacillus decolorationis TaxID=163879 RepID=UPI002148AF44|nr:galactosyldiacylglycerol synthase [Pseudalkalibacillus decolorationis]
MKKILFLPLFQMPSGHHQVADALIDSIQKSNESITCKKIDFLSYWNQPLEKTIASFYLKWISSLPKTYNWVYRRFMYEPKKNNIRAIDYVQLLGFETKMLELIQKERPDVIACTHSFPSALISRLKRNHSISVPVVNIYTDFFVNGIWGQSEIDLHLVNDQTMKKELINRGVQGDRIAITGIPTNDQILSDTVAQKSARKHILVAGGSSGVGSILEYLKGVRKVSNYSYTVLCGNNQKLFKEVSSWKVDHIQPKAYIDCRSEMNELYERADAILTKPGGITVSEALKKRMFIFVHSALPGQEQLNLKELITRQIITPVLDDRFEDQIASVLENSWKQKQIRHRIDEFLSSKESCPINEIINLLYENNKMLSTQPS